MRLGLAGHARARTTVVLTGTAQLDEFAVLADAVVKSLESNPAATVSPSPTPSP